jgi:hypothetical protein
MTKSKFHRKAPLKERLAGFAKGLFFWRSRKKGMIRTMNIRFKDVRAVFFPTGFHEKYRYLGAMPWKEDGDIFKAMYPLVLAMDYIAKPKWCPRWFLRFLHLFGSDNSIVRVRNWTLHNFEKRLTKGLMIYDYKTKWSHYDLRISVSGPEHINRLAQAIEHDFYKEGRSKELVEEIKSIDPDALIIWGSVERLEKQLEKLKESKDESKQDD